jgi:hypothetical protein
VTKAKEERELFREFATAARLGVDPDSIRSEDPPLPDISCRIAGKVRYFELTRAANQDIADEVGRLWVQGRRTGETGAGRAHVYGDPQTLRGAVERKAAATHETRGVPLDLLVYYDPAFHPSPEPEWVESTFRELQAKYRDRWNAMWLYDRTDKWILR